MVSYRLSVACLVLTVCAGAAAAQAPVTLRVRLQQGQTLRYRTEIETWVGVRNAAVDTTQPARVLTLFTTRTVAAVSGDTAIIRDQVDSAWVRTPGIRGVDTMAIRRAADAMRGVVTLTAVDGRGRLLDYAAGTTRTDSVDPALQAVLPMAGLLRVVFVLPADPVSPGSSWSERVASGDAAGSVSLTARYTLDRTARTDGRDIATISAAGEMGGGGVGSAMSARFDGTLDYDMGDSQPTRFVIMVQGTMAGRGGDLPMRIKRTLVRL